MCLLIQWKALILKEMNKEILIRFFNNQCTRAEINEIAEWVNNRALNETDKNWSFHEWRSLKIEDSENYDIKLNSLLDRIHHKINIEQSNSGLKKYTIKRIIDWAIRVAAIFLLPVLAFLIYSIKSNQTSFDKYARNEIDSLEIVAPIGSRTVVDLSDGTKIYLNFGSSIKYPQHFIGNTREVILKGEGYFEVAHNPQKPFIVKTEHIEIRALGTKFNVSAYPGNGVVATTLIEGKVIVERKKGKGAESLGSLVPGQHVSYNINSGDIISATGNTDRYIAWKDGKLVFQNESLEEVAIRLSRMFNVDIEISNEVQVYTYTVTFMDEPLLQILDLMALATPITYKALVRNKLPDGTYLKQKIIIEKRKW
jgi:ferric-dicitrate binding protein FerR (iron transport regulator)